MANYVKFLRGSPEAYAKLAQKDNDTLYFIYENDESNATLYLGSKLIAGIENGSDAGGVVSLADLDDVLISNNLINNSFLVYSHSDRSWINKGIDELFFIGAFEDKAGQGGFVPAPEAG